MWYMSKHCAKFGRGNDGTQICEPALDPLRALTDHQTMTRDTLLDIDSRRPFAPYSLRLNNEDVIRIEQPEHCLVTEDGQTLGFNKAGGKLKFVAVRNITVVE